MIISDVYNIHLDLFCAGVFLDLFGHNLISDDKCKLSLESLVKHSSFIYIYVIYVATLRNKKSWLASVCFC